MDAFLFYIDDWTSSHRVEEMDQLEELAYFRLLIYAAKQPDCGIPDNPKLLAKLSRLNGQWDQVTSDESYRFDDRTSGQKVVACFEIRHNGRLYNIRLLKTFIKYLETKIRTSGAAKKRWNQDAEPEHMLAQSLSYANALLEHSDATPYAQPTHDLCTPVASSVVSARASEHGNGNGHSSETPKSTEFSTTPAVPKPSGVLQFPVRVNGATALALPAEVDPAFSEWADAAYMRHPLQAKRYEAEYTLMSTFAANPKQRELFDRNHELWCQFWQRDKGAFVPFLHTFIDDKTWAKPPRKLAAMEQPEPRGKRGSEIV